MWMLKARKVAQPARNQNNQLLLGSYIEAFVYGRLNVYLNVRKEDIELFGLNLNMVYFEARYNMLVNIFSQPPAAALVPLRFCSIYLGPD